MEMIIILFKILKDFQIALKRLEKGEWIIPCMLREERNENEKFSFIDI